MSSSSLAPSSTVAVLLGGGIESTALVKRYLAGGHVVIPIHVHCGLLWDDCETLFVERFLAANAGPRLLPIREIRLPLHELLAGHWAVTGENVPRAGASAADLEIPLRNLTLLSFGLDRVRDTSPMLLALGTTADNHYRDGSREYFDRCEDVMRLEAGRLVRVLTPLIEIDKTQVIRESDRETLALSFSCVDPRQNRHCGLCIKCGKRQAAFRAAGVGDPTVYASNEQ